MPAVAPSPSVPPSRADRGLPPDFSPEAPPPYLPRVDRVCADADEPAKVLPGELEASSLRRNGPRAESWPLEALGLCPRMHGLELAPPRLLCKSGRGRATESSVSRRRSSWCSATLFFRRQRAARISLRARAADFLPEDGPDVRHFKISLIREDPLPESRIVGVVLDPKQA